MILLLLARASVASTPAVELAFWGLETSDGGFVDQYTSADVPQWSWGVVVGGPGASFDATRAWGTGLVGDYLSDSTNCLEIPVPSLAAAARPVLQFRHWFDLASGDVAAVAVDTGGGWVVVDPVYGYPSGAGWSGQSDGWELASVDLSGLGAAPRVCFRFAADDDSVVSDGWFVDDVGLYDGDPVPPRIESVSLLDDTEDLAGPYPVSAVVVDDAVVPGATLYWQTDGDPVPVAMAAGAADTFTASIPGQAPDTVVRWWVEATDGGNVGRAPTTGDWSFRVYLPAPTDLSGPSGRVVGTKTTLTWSPPDSTHAVEGYVIERQGVAVATVTALEADVPLSGDDDTFVVRALYAEGEGDASNPFTVDSVVPTLDPLSPAEGYPGDQLRLTLSGQYLLLVQDEVTLGFDAAVTVTEVTVRDVDLAWVEVAVDEDAAPGPVGMDLTTAAGDLRSDAAFTVLDGADRPRLVSIEPASLRQGASATLSLGFVGELAGEPTVDLGDDIVVESVTVQADTVSVEVAVANGAALGDRAVTIDDGVRLYSGVSLEIRDYLIDPGPPCGCAAPGASAPGGAGLLLGLVALTRRRR